MHLRDNEKANALRGHCPVMGQEAAERGSNRGVSDSKATALGHVLLWMSGPLGSAPLTLARSQAVMAPGYTQTLTRGVRRKKISEPQVPVICGHAQREVPEY